MAAIAIAFTSDFPTVPARRDGDAELAALICATASGDQTAFNKLYDSTNRPVFGLVLRVLRDHCAAEEVTLDVFLQVWNQAESYSPERGKPLTWMMMIARSRAIDRLRSSKHSKRENESLDNVTTYAADSEDPEEASIFAEKRRMIRSALEALSREQREVIEIAYFSGLSQSEIAERLGLPLGTVKTRIRSGLTKLKENLSFPA